MPNKYRRHPAEATRLSSSPTEAKRSAAICCKSVCALLLLLVTAAPLAAQTIASTPPLRSTPSTRATSVGAGVDRIPVDAIDHDLTRQALLRSSTPDGSPSPTARTPTSPSKPGTGIRRARGAIPAERATSPARRTSTGFIRHSFGYRLPHRGVTRNDGTGNVGFSRITDGDEAPTGRAIPTSPAASPAKTTRSIRNGSSSICARRARRYHADLLGRTLREPTTSSSTGPASDPLHFPTRGAWVTFPRGVVTAGARRPGDSSALRASHAGSAISASG